MWLGGRTKGRRAWGIGKDRGRRHPSEWSFCGYNEIQKPPQRYSIVDHKRKMELVGIGVGHEVGRTYRGSVDEILKCGAST